MAGKAMAKQKVKNGNGTEPLISMTYIDDILLRLDKTEGDIDELLNDLDSLGLRVKKVEVRLGID